jgi:hypothetical protein
LARTADPARHLGWQMHQGGHAAACLVTAEREYLQPSRLCGLRSRVDKVVPRWDLHINPDRWLSIAAGCFRRTHCKNKDCFPEIFPSGGRSG